MGNTQNGEKVTQGDFEVELAPLLSKDVQLKLPEILAKQGEEYLLNIYVVTKREMPLIPVGHTIAYEQFGFATNDYFHKFLPILFQ